MADGILFASVSGEKCAFYTHDHTDDYPWVLLEPNVLFGTGDIDMSV